MTAAAARIEKPARTGSEPQRIVGQAGRRVVGSPDGAMPDGSQRLVQLAQRLFAVHRRQRFEKTQSPLSGLLPQSPPPVLQYGPHRFPQKTDRSYAVELNLPRRFEALQRGRVHRALEPRPQRTENSRRFPAGAAETADRRTAFVRPAGQPGAAFRPLFPAECGNGLHPEPVRPLPVRQQHAETNPVAERGGRHMKTGRRFAQRQKPAGRRIGGRCRMFRQFVRFAHCPSPFFRSQRAADNINSPGRFINPEPRKSP